MSQTDTVVDLSKDIVQQINRAFQAEVLVLRQKARDTERLRTERDLLLSMLVGLHTLVGIDPALNIKAEIEMRLREYQQTKGLLHEIQKENTDAH